MIRGSGRHLDSPSLINAFPPRIRAIDTRVGAAMNFRKAGREEVFPTERRRIPLEIYSTLLRVGVVNEQSNSEISKPGSFRGLSATNSRRKNVPTSIVTRETMFLINFSYRIVFLSILKIQGRQIRAKRLRK